MTLKEFLEKNEIKATGKQRSQIGYKISQIGDNYGYVLEDGHNVKNYHEHFLNEPRTIDIILNHLIK